MRFSQVLCSASTQALVSHERCDLLFQHPERMEERCFVTYRPPTLEGSPAQVEEYLEQAQFIAEDLDWLLALPHDKFWCQVVFDVSLQQCLDSYLRLAPRGLDCNLATSPRVSDMQRHLHRCVFMTFLRMATHKESRVWCEHFLSPAVFGEIIYNNFLFDIPKILDLCVLFGKGNGMLLNKMIDETRASYILQGIDCGLRKKHSLSPVRSTPASELSSEARSEREGPRGATGGTGAQQEFYSEDYDPGAPGCALSAGELESLVFQVRDLLPDLGEGFIMACLQEYGNNSERVINNILEGKLSPRLEKLDHSLPRPVKEQLPEVLKSRSNVFDDDEFDVFTRDVLDTSRIWKGRSEDYDDEYDDTYDGGQVGANDLDEGSELLARRPFTIPRVLRDGREEEELKEERDYEEEEEEKDNAVMRDQFVQDPAVLRERAEARRAANYNRRGFKADTPGSAVGAAKGRGQSKETVQERRKKEANKSGRANHNRRAMADRKRNKGMIPS
ncbi:Activating signal cointegrator 1 complex subunit 2 [Acipenser ruthenus]|uniref:Activating signal cointegrator 1 complex subunit 2 n=1 Tax=Acipenser ruthenus TaxID=7906 RepID=A0A444V534_ACIRT|nr:Activating signal cointegrator 1 complex subunit 2 [Acipenser ruthenus]